MMAATCEHTVTLLRLACWSMLVFGRGALASAPGQAVQEMPLPEPTPSFFVKQLGIVEFQQFINQSNVGIVYFQRRDSKRIQAFLREFEKSAQRLHAFSINLGKVDCNQHVVDKYCQDERSFHNAFGFRDAKEKIALPLDTLFDVDSIVSSALHLALIHSVPIIQSHRERVSLEKKCKRRYDIIFTYQRALGTYEHRVFMELAFTFLEKYVFALTTHELATQGLRRSNREVDRNDEEAPGADSAIWALFCQEVGDLSEDCSQSAFYGPVHQKDLAQFIQALDHPPWSLFDGRQERPFPTPAHMHSLYLFHDGSSEIDAVTSLADRLARKFRGSLAVVLVSRTSLDLEGAIALGMRSVDDIKASGIALRVKLQNGLQWIDEVDAERHIADRLKDWPYTEPEPAVSNREADQDQRDQLAELRQDDDVAEHVRRVQHISLLPAITGSNFSEAMQRSLTAVLLYVNWDPRSQVMLEILSSVQETLQSSADFPPDAAVFRLNCFDWPELCEVRNVTAYPTLLIMTLPREIITYVGLLQLEAVMTALYQSWIPNLHLLDTVKVGIDFVSGKSPASLRRWTNGVTLVGFSSNEFPQGESLVADLSRKLLGSATIGCVKDDIALEIGRHHGAERLPFVLVFKWNNRVQPVIRMSENLEFNLDVVLEFLKNTSVSLYDELTAENFPEYWQKAQQYNNLLFIYVTSEPMNDPIWDSVSTIAAEGIFPQLTFSWMSSGNQLTRELLRFYKLEDGERAVVAIDFHKKIYFTMGNEQLTTSDDAETLRLWLKNLTEGVLIPSGSLRDDRWKPLHPGFDYLRLIDEDMDRELDDHLHDHDDSHFDSGVIGSSGSEKMYPNFRMLRTHRVGNDVKKSQVTTTPAKIEL